MARKGFLELGSGKALCQICEEKIKKGVPQISHRANRCSVSFHANAKDCGIPRSVKSIKQRSCEYCNQDGGRIQRSDRYPPYKKRTVCGNCYREVGDGKYFDSESTVKNYGMFGAGVIAILALLSQNKR